MEMISVPFSASALAHQGTAPGEGAMIYPAFYHSESSITSTCVVRVQWQMMVIIMTLIHGKSPTYPPDHRKMTLGETFFESWNHATQFSQGLQTIHTCWIKLYRSYLCYHIWKRYSVFTIWWNYLLTRLFNYIEYSFMFLSEKFISS